MGCLREKCLYPTVQCHACPCRVLPHICLPLCLSCSYGACKQEFLLLLASLFPWGCLGVSFSRCLDTALLNAWHLRILVINISSNAGIMCLYIHVCRQSISMPVCWWWRFWELCIQRKAEENKSVIPGDSSGSVTFSRVLIPAKEVTSSKKEQETTIILRYVTLTNFLA